MWTVAAVLVLPAVYGVSIFGLNALITILISVASCVATEFAIYGLFRHKTTVQDGSAVVTGLLLAFVLPPASPWYVPLVGGVFAIAVVKLAFGGLGYNIWNPALAARAFLLACWSVSLVSTWTNPVAHVRELRRTNDQLQMISTRVDGVTAATPLNARKRALAVYNEAIQKGREQSLPPAFRIEDPKEILRRLNVANKTSYLDLLVGLRGGCIGETCVVLLLLGGTILLIRGYIKWYIPIPYIATVALLTWALPVRLEMPGGAARLIAFAGDPLFHVLSGGLVLGAFFMATDMVTSPLTQKGCIIFAVGCGLMTALIRIYGGYPEGVCYSILLMNTATPLIDRYTKPKTFGAVKK